MTTFFNEYRHAIVSLLLLVFIGAEYIYHFLKKTSAYKKMSTASSISLHYSSQIVNILIVGVFLLIANKITTIIKLPYVIKGSTPLELILGVLVWDFFFYWTHRFTHTFSTLWKIHRVHHQCEEINLAIATRIPWLSKLTRVPFMFLMVALGFDPLFVLMSVSLVGFYQFIVHLHGVKKIDFFELLLVTPSNHRVHHSRNAADYNKNFGGILIIWDKFFGTYKKEESDIRFGINGHHFNSDLFDANFGSKFHHLYIRLTKFVENTIGPGETKVSSLFMILEFITVFSYTSIILKFYKFGLNLEFSFYLNLVASLLMWNSFSAQFFSQARSMIFRILTLIVLINLLVFENIISKNELYLVVACFFCLSTYSLYKSQKSYVAETIV